MNSILLRTPIEIVRSTAGGSILAVEPDAGCAAFLRDALRGLADLQIVPAVAEAVEAIRRRLPDVVIASPLLPPADEVALSACVRESDDASHVQMICAPYAAAGTPPARTEEPSSNILGFLVRRRPVPAAQTCDPAVVRQQIADYLADAVRCREEREDVSEQEAPVSTPSGLVAVASQEVHLSPSTSVFVKHVDDERRRARRLRSDEIPSIWTVKFPWGDAGRVVDISTRGALVESPTKVAPGNTINLQLLGESVNLVVSARTVRAEVARIDRTGVKYHLATAFSREIELSGFELSSASRYTPRLLVDLLTRVLDENGEPRDYLALRARLESAMRHMFRVRDIQLRETILKTDPDAESIYFNVSEGSRRPRILQVVFDAGTRPSAVEFRALRAAAGLVGVLLQFAAHDEPFSA
jgi:hypothetical protein